MSPLRFHHVGVGTARFEEAIAVYERLGYRLALSIDDPGLDVRVAFLEGGGGPWVELLGPLGPEGPLKSYLSRRILPAPYHTCYATAELEAAGEALREGGFLPLGAARPALAFRGARVAFHYHPAIGLVELVENPPF